MDANADMIACVECGQRVYRRSYDDGDFVCQLCHMEARDRAKRDEQPQRLAQSVALTLTPRQFTYLQAAVKRDLGNLAEMAPWDIDDQTAEHEQDVRTCKSMIAMLAKVEQEQVVPF